MTSAATKHRLQVLSPRAARHHSIASSHIPARPTSIKPLACCFPHKPRTLPSTFDGFRRTLSPVREQRFWWRSVQENIMNLLLNFTFNSFCIYYFAGKDSLVHMHRQVFWEKFIFPMYKHAFRGWKDSSPATLSAIYPPYLKSRHDECALKSNLDWVWWCVWVVSEYTHTHTLLLRPIKTSRMHHHAVISEHI